MVTTPSERPTRSCGWGLMDKQRVLPPLQRKRYAMCSRGLTEDPLPGGGVGSITLTPLGPFPSRLTPPTPLPRTPESSPEELLAPKPSSQASLLGKPSLSQSFSDVAST